MEQVAKIILINDKNEFLFQLRDNNPKIVHPSGWSLFGGGINNREEILMGLKREIKEEIPDCFVEDINFVGKGYVEEKDMNLVNYWISAISNPISTALAECVKSPIDILSTPVRAISSSPSSVTEPLASKRSFPSRPASRLRLTA